VYPYACHKHPGDGPMDEVHTRTCPRTGLQNRTHDGLQNVLGRELLRGMGHLGGVREKDRAPFHPPPLGGCGAGGASGAGGGERAGTPVGHTRDGLDSAGQGAGSPRG
jgi:hypothetical protein